MTQLLKTLSHNVSDWKKLDHFRFHLNFEITGVFVFWSKFPHFLPKLGLFWYHLGSFIKSPFNLLFSLYLNCMKSRSFLIRWKEAGTSQGMHILAILFFPNLVFCNRGQRKILLQVFSANSGNVEGTIALNAKVNARRTMFFHRQVFSFVVENEVWNIVPFKISATFSPFQCHENCRWRCDSSC